MPRVHTVKKARKAYPPDIEKGDTYYHWRFYKSAKIRSKKYPKPWELTRSPYLSQLLEAQDGWYKTVSGASELDDLTELIDDIKGDVDNLRSECQDSLDNMPEHLQDTADSGILLTERIDTMDNFDQELDQLDIDSAKEDLNTAKGEFAAGQLKEDEYNGQVETALEEAKEKLEDTIGNLEIN